MKFFLRFLFAIILFSSFQYSYAQKKEVVKRKTEAKKKESKKKGENIRYGIASYYASKFHGRHTNNDEIYDSTKYTAACNVFPLNTWLKVTNLMNKRSIIVKVNDRMNPKNTRLVDLSKIAAKKLGFISKGIVRVKVEVLNRYKEKK